MGCGGVGMAGEGWVAVLFFWVLNEARKSKTKEHQEQTSEFLNDMIIYLDDNFASLFKRKKDLNVADAVLELMKRSNDIENFNKKSLYILIREMTGSNTQHITRVINILKRYYKKLHLEYSKHGTLEYLSSGSIFM